jgi:hypothetical protein
MEQKRKTISATFKQELFFDGIDPKILDHDTMSTSIIANRKEEILLAPLSKGTDDENVSCEREPSQVSHERFAFIAQITTEELH